jgi:hypothetical protein
MNTKSSQAHYFINAARAWSQFREACITIFPHGLPETIGDARFVKFDANWTPEPVQAPKRRLAWFLPGGSLRIRRNTTDGVLAWLTWVVVPEPFIRSFIRSCINIATMTPILILTLVAIVLVVAMVMDMVNH